MSLFQLAPICLGLALLASPAWASGTVLVGGKKPPGQRFVDLGNEVILPGRPLLLSSGPSFRDRVAGHGTPFTGSAVAPPEVQLAPRPAAPHSTLSEPLVWSLFALGLLLFAARRQR